MSHTPSGTFIAMRPAGACLIVVLAAACAGESGASSVSAAVDAYLAAVSAHDAMALRRVVPPDFDAESAIAQKLDKYAGIDVASLRRAYVPHEITPKIVTVVVSRTTPPFEDVIGVQRFGRTWYVLLGRLRGFTPGPTSQIRPPSTYDSPRDDRHIR